MIPLPGASAVERVRENSTLVQLSGQNMQETDDILKSFPVAGDRYPAAAAKLTEG